MEELNNAGGLPGTAEAFWETTKGRSKSNCRSEKPAIPRVEVGSKVAEPKVRKGAAILGN